jgi:hypothetical protein
MKHFFARLLLLPLLLAMLAGCFFDANPGEEANQIISTVHKGFQTGNWQEVMPLYDAQFLRIHQPKAWQQKMTTLIKPLGKLESIKLTFKHYDPRMGGVFYTYGFLLHFEHGTITETLAIFKDSDKKHMTISGHELRLNKHLL